jgi:hypothetical protein
VAKELASHANRRYSAAPTGWREMNWNTSGTIMNDDTIRLIRNIPKYEITTPVVTVSSVVEPHVLSFRGREVASVLQ